MNDRTPYGVIQGSNWDWKDAPGIYFLSHPVTQQDIPPMEVVLD